MSVGRNVTKVNKRHAGGKKREVKRGLPGVIPGRAALTGATNRIPHRSPNKALANSAANV
ncbi:hypothetical protein NUKP40_39640 [Klebsiella variicola]|nr:hypothetical protein NUKP40_39640 [Klebsiella variicola]